MLSWLLLLVGSRLHSFAGLGWRACNTLIGFLWSKIIRERNHWHLLLALASALAMWALLILLVLNAFRSQAAGTFESGVLRRRNAGDSIPFWAFHRTAECLGA
ncbi:hypothetical protein DC522_14370 [Microvirga sp. KLBC 81]|nr:hypothetical protein DC522_14370 [Microvirga sp. KLBC 81]